MKASIPKVHKVASWFKITLNVKISNGPAESCQDIEL